MYRKEFIIQGYLWHNVSMEICFTRTLKRSLKNANITDISRQLGIPRSILQDWLYEERLPSMKNLIYVKRLAEYLNISLEEILFGECENNIMNCIDIVDEDKCYQIVVLKKANNPNLSD